jgi:hypothetical protein
MNDITRYLSKSRNPQSHVLGLVADRSFSLGPGKGISRLIASGRASLAEARGLRRYCGGLL